MARDTSDNPFATAVDDVAVAAGAPAEAVTQPPRAQPHSGGGGAAESAVSSAFDAPLSPLSLRPPPAPTVPVSVSAGGGASGFGFFGVQVAPLAPGAAPPTPKPFAPTAAELAARERALRDREAALAMREAALDGQLGESFLRPNNWPRCHPILRLDIDADIPPTRRRAVKMLYLAWIAAASGYLLNLLIMTIASAAGGRDVSPLNWFLSVLLAGAGIPCSVRFWLLGGYAASQPAAGMLSKFAAQAHLAIHILLCVWMCVGAPKIGYFAAGLLRGITWLAQGDATGSTIGAMALINASLWLASFCLSVAFIQRLARDFHSAGGVAGLRRERAAAAGRMVSVV